MSTQFHKDRNGWVLFIILHNPCNWSAGVLDTFQVIVLFYCDTIVLSKAFNCDKCICVYLCSHKYIKYNYNYVIHVWHICQSKSAYISKTIRFFSCFPPVCLCIDYLISWYFFHAFLREVHRAVFFSFKVHKIMHRFHLPQLTLNEADVKRVYPVRRGYRFVLRQYILSFDQLYTLESIASYHACVKSMLFITFKCPFLQWTFDKNIGTLSLLVRV